MRLTLLKSVVSLNETLSQTASGRHHGGGGSGDALGEGYRCLNLHFLPTSRECDRC